MNPVRPDLTLRQKFLNWPNYITMGRFVAVLLLAIVMGFMDDYDPSFEPVNEGLSLAAAVIFLLAMISDMIDGYLARRMQIVSTFGQFFDPLADKLLFLVAMIFMVELGRLPAWIVCVFLSREVIVTALRGVAIDEGVVIAASHWGKYKSAVVSVTTVSLLIHDPLWGMNARMIGWFFIWPALFLSIISGIHYTVGFVKALRRKSRG